MRRAMERSMRERIQSSRTFSRVRQQDTMPDLQETDQVQMGLEMQARAEQFYQDLEGKTCYARMLTEAVLGLQLDLCSHCEVIHHLHPAIRSWNV